MVKLVSHDKDGTTRVANNPFGNTADQEPRHPAAPLAAHQDQISAHFRGHLNDLCVAVPFSK
jgi:hypothetical protein